MSSSRKSLALDLKMIIVTIIVYCAIYAVSLMLGGTESLLYAIVAAGWVGVLGTLFGFGMLSSRLLSIGLASLIQTMMGAVLLSLILFASGCGGPVLYCVAR